jgi:hypothetical protein
MTWAGDDDGKVMGMMRMRMRMRMMTIMLLLLMMMMMDDDSMDDDDDVLRPSRPCALAAEQVQASGFTHAVHSCWYPDWSPLLYFGMLTADEHWALQDGLAGASIPAETPTPVVRRYTTCAYVGYLCFKESNGFLCVGCHWPGCPEGRADDSTGPANLWHT